MKYEILVLEASHIPSDKIRWLLVDRQIKARYSPGSLLGRVQDLMDERSNIVHDVSYAIPDMVTKWRIVVPDERDFAEYPEIAPLMKLDWLSDGD